MWEWRVQGLPFTESGPISCSSCLQRATHCGSTLSDHQPQLLPSAMIWSCRKTTSKEMPSRSNSVVVSFGFTALCPQWTAWGTHPESIFVSLNERPTHIRLLLKCLSYLKSWAFLNLPLLPIGPIGKVASDHFSEVSHGWCVLSPATPASLPSTSSLGHSVLYLYASSTLKLPPCAFGLWLLSRSIKNQLRSGTFNIWTCRFQIESKH